MFRTLIRSILEYVKWIGIKRMQRQVNIDRSTRLLRGFGVTFLVKPNPRAYLRIGHSCLLNSHVVFESSDGLVEIGDRVYIGTGTQIISRNHVQIGNDVTMAWGVTLYDHNSHSLDWRQRQRVVTHFYSTYGKPACFDSLDWSDVGSAPIIIEDRVWIGFDAVILKGVTIGKGAVIGARSVVTKDVEPYTVVAGNPATVVRRLIPAHEITPEPTDSTSNPAHANR